MADIDLLNPETTKNPKRLRVHTAVLKAQVQYIDDAGDFVDSKTLVIDLKGSHPGNVVTKVEAAVEDMARYLGKIA